MRFIALALLLPLAACGPGGRNVPGDSNDHRPFAQIAPDEMLHLAGMEPFWSGDVAGNQLLWKTPDKPDGQAVTVSRFAGRGGLSFSGSLDGMDLLVVVTPGECSDGMSERAYPFVVTLQLGAQSHEGCAWSAEHPFREARRS